MQDASQAAAPGAPGPAPSPAGPVRVSSGHLRGIDHSARGEASIIRQPDGSHVVRFSNFDIQSSPGPIVYVIEGENRDNPGGADSGACGAVSAPTPTTSFRAGPTRARAFAVPIANATQAAA